MAAEDSSQTAPTVESWSERDQSIVVSQPTQGVLYDLALRAKLDATPQQVYDVLTHPASHEVFRGIKEVVSRETLEDNGKGQRKLLVAHRSTNKLLWLTVTFETKLYVWEDDVARTIRFTNANSDGFMKQFEGTWQVDDFSQDTLDRIYRPQKLQERQHHAWFSPAGALSAMQHGFQQPKAKPEAALVTLKQALAPRAVPPAPVARLVRRFVGGVVSTMMDDLRVELERRKKEEQQQQWQLDSVGTGQPAAVMALASTTRQQIANGSRRVAQQKRQQQAVVASLSGAAMDLWGSATPLHVIIQL